MWQTQKLILTGHTFSFPMTKTWEFTSSAPIRSIFALWPVYGMPMLILRWLTEGLGQDNINSMLIFRTLRFVMFMLSFVLEDWAIHELVEHRQQRRFALMLVASSYVTWTWQSHTFSNAVETILVLWSIVLCRRLARNEVLGYFHCKFVQIAYVRLGTSFHYEDFRNTCVSARVRDVQSCHISRVCAGTSSAACDAEVCFWKLHSRRSHLITSRPLAILRLAAVCALTTLAAITVDTLFYNDRDDFGLLHLVKHPIIAPLNSLLYNTRSANLALHGTHPYWQHFVVNLPQFLGPATILLFTNPIHSTPLFSALAGTVTLSAFSHQEARFLLPAVPLILSSVQLPQHGRRLWIAVWIVFNSLLGILMGVYHQGGIVEAQAYIRGQPDVGQAFWWKTYSPPTWILGYRNSDIVTVDLMGLGKQDLTNRICSSVGQKTDAVLVVPRSATFLDKFGVAENSTTSGLQLSERVSIRSHLNLDDMDFGDDGVLPTLTRVIGRRGLTVFDVRCSDV